MTSDLPWGASAPPSFDDQVVGIASLGDPVRRALYNFVVSQDGPVSRDEAAHGAQVARHIAKFHLDKLVDDGLLEAEFSRPPGRTGPGAGRPAKRYRRSSLELSVSLPQRNYELAGRLLAGAVNTAEREHIAVGDALQGEAKSFGRLLGLKARRYAGRNSGERALLAGTTQVLGECGYEPHTEADGLSLENCPFHALAQDYTDLVCGVNLDLMQGLLEVLELPGFEACLEPQPGKCCVRLRRE